MGFQIYRAVLTSLWVVSIVAGVLAIRWSLSSVRRRFRPAFFLSLSALAISFLGIVWPAPGVANVTGSSVGRFAADAFFWRLWVNYALGSRMLVVGFRTSFMKTNSLLGLTLLALFLSMVSPCLGADKVPDGWRKRGSTNDYEVGVDGAVRTGGKRSAYLKTTSMTPKNFVNLMQSFRADDYRGKRLRLSAQVKVQGIAGAASLWMRIDSESKTLGLDNMSDRAIRSPADWKRQEIVLDVPRESLNVSFGVMFEGRGQAWVDDFQFEVVGKDVPVTRASEATPSARKVEPAAQTKPLNLDFEK